MNFVDKDGTTKVYIPVHPWKTGMQRAALGKSGSAITRSDSDSIFQRRYDRDDGCYLRRLKSIYVFCIHVGARSNFFLGGGGVSGSEDRGGSDNSIHFINFGRVGDKSFKEWRQKIGGRKGG